MERIGLKLLLLRLLPRFHFEFTFRFFIIRLRVEVHHFVESLSWLKPPTQHWGLSRPFTSVYRTLISRLIRLRHQILEMNELLLGYSKLTSGIFESVLEVQYIFSKTDLLIAEFIDLRFELINDSLELLLFLSNSLLHKLIHSPRGNGRVSKTQIHRGRRRERVDLLPQFVLIWLLFKS
jgi:hypothetical protein